MAALAAASDASSEFELRGGGSVPVVHAGSGASAQVEVVGGGGAGPAAPADSNTSAEVKSMRGGAPAVFADLDASAEVEFVRLVGPKKRPREIVVERTGCEKHVASEALRATGGDIEEASLHVSRLLHARAGVNGNPDSSFAEWQFASAQRARAAAGERASAERCRCMICLGGGEEEDDDEEEGEGGTLLELVCGHRFHRSCLRRQLDSRVRAARSSTASAPMERITFDYLGCALCRAPIVHPAFDLREVPSCRP